MKQRWAPIPPKSPRLPPRHGMAHLAFSSSVHQQADQADLGPLPFAVIYTCDLSDSIFFLSYLSRNRVRAGASCLIPSHQENASASQGWEMAGGGGARGAGLGVSSSYFLERMRVWWSSALAT